jgi:hypothetical protein
MVQSCRRPASMVVGEIIDESFGTPDFQTGDSHRAGLEVRRTRANRPHSSYHFHPSHRAANDVMNEGSPKCFRFATLIAGLRTMFRRGG